MGILILLVVVVLGLGSLPAWHHSREWGYKPSIGVGLLFIALIVLMFMRVIPSGF